MILEYIRPQKLDEALMYLEKPNHYPMGGGTWLSMKRDEAYVVVDLQSLGLNSIEKKGNNLKIGACATLQDLYEWVDCPLGLKKAIRLEAGHNLRNAASIAGSLVTCDGHSPFATSLLGLDAKISFAGKPADKEISLGDYLPMRPKGLITRISIPLNVNFAFESVGRSKYDQPVVCAAVARWGSGRTRLALGGCFANPTLAMDGTEADGIEAAAQNAFQDAQDEWASSAYRREIAATLASRCLKSMDI